MKSYKYWEKQAKYKEYDKLLIENNNLLFELKDIIRTLWDYGCSLLQIEENRKLLDKYRHGAKCLHIFLHRDDKIYMMEFDKHFAKIMVDYKYLRGILESLKTRNRMKGGARKL